MSQFYQDSVFWVDIDKIEPNPFQPRKEFDEAQLKSLADSIRQYGVLQALVVTRSEYAKPDGGLGVKYELIAGERRLRASKIAGLSQVPVLIKTGEESDLMKLELAIIENVQREDLNPVDRAKAFQRLVDEFGFKHVTIAKKVGKSREYVSNTIRLLALPTEIMEGVAQGRITEGHTRPLLMLIDRPEEQQTLYKEIVYRKLTVREAERIARTIAVEKVRKHEFKVDPEITALEEKLSETFGTRVQIERKVHGGKLLIDFFSNEDLHQILQLVKNASARNPNEMLEKHIANQETGEPTENVTAESPATNTSNEDVPLAEDQENPNASPVDDRSAEEKAEQEQEDQEIYSVKNFTI